MPAGAGLWCVPWCDAPPLARQVSPRPGADKYADKSAARSRRAAGWHPPPSRLPYVLLITLPAGATIPAQTAAAHFLCWVPASAEAFSFELQPTASWAERQRGRRRSVGKSWEEGSPVQRMAGKPLRFPVALSAGRRRGAWSLPALHALPGISESQPRLPLTAKYFTLETYYTS